MKTIEELNQYNDSGRMLTREEIIAEYNALYKPAPTPLTNPELFDPFNPPAGWAYDAYHAFWWRTPTEGQYKSQVAVVWAGLAVVVAFALYVGLYGPI